MQSSTNSDKAGFDASVRIFSLLSLLSTIGILFVRFLPPQRGIQFVTHVSMILGFLHSLLCCYCSQSSLLFSEFVGDFGAVVPALV